MNKLERQSNIELLRILSMLGVIVLHYNNGSIGGALKIAQQGSLNYYFLIVLESIAICAVNLFVLISGYFLCKSKKSTIDKPIKLVLQTILFSFSFTLAKGVIYNNLSIESLLNSLVPSNYFVILYIALYLISPYLNLLYEKMDKKFIITILLLFSIYPTIVDLFSQITGKEWMGLSSIGAYGSQNGYQIVNFILMYYVGMFINKYEDKIKLIKTKKIIICLICTIFFITVFSSISNNMGYSRTLMWMYSNPLVIFEASLYFIIFKRCNIGNVKIINKLSAASFTVFLAHTYFLGFFKIGLFVNRNILILTFHIVVTTIFIYCICYVMYSVYNLIAKHTIDKIITNGVIVTQI